MGFLQEQELQVSGLEVEEQSWVVVSGLLQASVPRMQVYTQEEVELLEELLVFEQEVLLVLGLHIEVLRLLHSLVLGLVEELVSEPRVAVQVWLLLYLLQVQVIPFLKRE